MIDVDPDLLTWMAFGFAILAGVAFYFGGPLFLFAAMFCVFFNALFDALDGRIAKLTGKASDRGDFLDHVLDRYADIFMLGGIAFGPFCDYRIGVLAIIGVLLASYMGTQAQAVGVGRDYGGLLGRADRLVIVVVAAFLQLIFILISRPDLRIIEWAMILFAVLGNLTAIQRGFSTWRKLSRS
ncbi:MAG: CDP-alcohol phosphatidyltransferase family protein [Methanomassiliicoccales archaeon]|nr:CDP-alcohol phosphatidyltransferase family protein [Methanomassiliicoccales archaeon]